MFPARFGPDFIKNLDFIPEKQAVIIYIKEFGFVDAADTLRLDNFRNLQPLEGFLVGSQGRFGQFDDIPDGVDPGQMQPLDEDVIVLYQSFGGVYKLGEEINLAKEVESGKRLVSLERQAFVVFKEAYALIRLEESSTSDCEELVIELRAEIRQLKAENTSLRQQLAELPGLRLQIDRLKDEVVARDNEILELKARIQQMIDATKRTPDDFATAVSDSVDKLQTKLTNLPNKTSDFVVREFSLDAKIYVDVNEQGQIDYRFIRPGDNVAPEKVSNLSLTLAPVPKPEPSPETPPPTDPVPTPAPGGRALLPGQDIPIEQLTGEDAPIRERLARSNIRSVADFLQVATRARTLAAFSGMLEIDRQRLGNWLMQAQLMAAGGLSAAMAQALIDLGFTTLKALAEADAAALLAQYNARAAGLSLPAVTLEDVQRWIAAAQASLKG